MNITPNQKRILIISNLYPSKKVPFYGSFVKNFIDELEKYAPQANIKKCLLKGKSKTSVNKLFKYTWFYLNIFYYLIFYKYDFIYIHLITHSTIPIRIVSKFKKLRLIFNIHGEDLLVTTPLAARLLDLAKPLVSKSELIVVPSLFFKKLVLEKIPCISEKKIFVSASGGVKKEFYISQVENHQVPIIGYVSRIDRGKGWDTFLSAAKNINDKGYKCLFKIIGGGQEVMRLQTMIDELFLPNVEYIGPVEYSCLPEVYSSFDLFIFPTKLVESLGLVGLEAMASGTPVIASNIGGITDYIDNDINGFLFEPGDINDLTSKIENFLSLSQIERNKISTNARKTALHYRDDVVARDLFTYIFNLIK